MHWEQGLIVVIVYYFQIWNKKGHNVIISRIISSHMGPIYIEKACDLFFWLHGWFGIGYEVGLGRDRLTWLPVKPGSRISRARLTHFLNRLLF